MKGKLFKVKFYLILFFLSFTINAQILNGGFEIWSNNFNPDDWISLNSSEYSVIIKSTEKHSGQYAVKGEVVDYDSSSIPPILYGGSDGQGFHVAKRYASLDGYYKFVPVTGDVFDILIEMYKGTMLLASLDTVLDPSSGYTSFELPIRYFNPDTPDRFYIKFIVNDTTGALPAHIGSYFLLDDLELTGESVTDVLSSNLNIPDGFYVYQNFPNPFNPSTTIRYSIPENADVAISIYDINGNLISNLINNRQSAGIHEISWNGKNNSGQPVVSGVYIYKVQAGSFSKTSKMILIK